MAILAKTVASSSFSLQTVLNFLKKEENNKNKKIVFEVDSFNEVIWLSLQ